MDGAPQHDSLHRQRRARARARRHGAAGRAGQAKDRCRCGRSSTSAITNRCWPIASSNSSTPATCWPRRGSDRGRRRPADDRKQALLHLQNAAFAAEEDLVGAAEVVAGLDGGGRRARADRGSARRRIWRGDRARRRGARHGVRGHGPAAAAVVLADRGQRRVSACAIDRRCVAWA